MLCLHVMVVHVVHMPFGFFMSWWFMLFMCFDVPSCHGGSCCSCAMLLLHDMVVHVVHVSWRCLCHDGSCYSCVIVFF